MFLLALLLVTMSLAAEEEKTIDNYVVKITDNTLTNVQPTETSSHALDLSGLSLRFLDKDVFDNLATLKNLRLANNPLSSVPKRIFSKLGNLEHLCLANNNISNFRDAFVGLDRLKTLNISGNPVKKMRCSEFYGLPKSSVVFTEGLTLSTISSHVFEKSAKDREEIDEDNEEPKQCRNQCSQKRAQNFTNTIKVCIVDGVLESVDTLEENEALPSGCRQLKFNRMMPLNNLGISKFKRGWCRLDSNMISTVKLAGNEIVEVTREMFDSLPANIFDVDLSNNKIERLEKEIIDRKFIFMDLSNNRISEIENGAFSKTHLRNLFLTDNLLKDTKFIKSLPTTIERLHLDRNKIAEISASSFPDFDRPVYLHLDDNLIQELKVESFDGRPYLFRLQLSNNRISNVQPGCFDNIPFLHSIVLNNNNITSLEKGTFDGLETLGHLDIGHNKLWNANEFFRSGLPPNLFSLKCDFNDIEKLERGAFKNVPKRDLILDGNRISNIEQGTFDLPWLKMLSLDNNKLQELDGDSFQGLNDVKRLSLVGNGITTIPKKFMENLGSLHDLDLGNNSIKKLENGALCGLDKSQRSLVHLDNVPVEIIEGGLFDDL